MMTLACLAAAGLIMGMFLNSYALAAASFGVALASGVMAANVGFGHASILMIVSSSFRLAILLDCSHQLFYILQERLPFQPRESERRWSFRALADCSSARRFFPPSRRALAPILNSW
jgi:hypothetical protein